MIRSTENRDWLISRGRIENCRLPLAFELQHLNTYLFTYPENLKKFRARNKDIYVLIDGFILPRLDCFDRYKEHKAEDLIAALYEEFGASFIQHIKGSFVLLFIVEGKVYLYTDRIGRRRCFYTNKEFFHISNSLQLLTEGTDLELDMDSIVLLSLMHHFIDGKTVFKHIRYTPPASYIDVVGEVSIKRYWDPSSLLNLAQGTLSFEDMAAELVNIAESYLRYFSPSEVSLTLTGGMDSRTILATLWKIGIRPYTFTFGKCLSSDVTIAHKIASEFNLEYSNHYESPTDKWYNALVEEIISDGHSLIHIHRAHRLDAIKKEMAVHPRVEMLFVGSMGGEFIRGLHYDDLIVTDFVRRIHSNRIDMADLIRKKCEDYFIRFDGVKIGNILDILKQQRYFQEEKKRNEFFVLFDLVANLHDTQDISLWSKYVKYVIPLFMDIDWLNVLFASSFSMLEKEKTAKNIFKKLDIPEMNCKILRTMCPRLCTIPFSNGFTPNEYLRGPLFYLGARILRRLFGEKYPPNFPYTGFFLQFIRKQFDALDYQYINHFYDIERAKAALRGNRHGTQEGYWHKFSNIVMVNKFMNNFRSKQTGNKLGD